MKLGYFIYMFIQMLYYVVAIYSMMITVKLSRENRMGYRQEIEFPASCGVRYLALCPVLFFATSK